MSTQVVCMQEEEEEGSIDSIYHTQKITENTTPATTDDPLTQAEEEEREVKSLDGSPPSLALKLLASRPSTAFTSTPR